MDNLGIQMFNFNSSYSNTYDLARLNLFCIEGCHVCLCLSIELLSRSSGHRAPIRVVVVMFVCVYL